MVETPPSLTAVVELTAAEVRLTVVTEVLTVLTFLLSNVHC